MTIRDHKENANFGVSRNLGPTAKIMIIYAAVMSLANRIMESVFVLLTAILGPYMHVDEGIVNFVDSISKIPLIDMILGPVFVIGLSSAALTLQRGREAHHSQLWAGFKHFFKSFWLYWSCRIISLLWGLLFIVPGIMRYYSYSMAPFIMAEHPDLRVKEVRRMSRELTNEYKLRIFLLDLSFIGWGAALLALAVLLKIGMVLVWLILIALISMWLVPYHMTARADLYQYIKSQKGLVDTEKCEDASADSTEEEVEYFPITEEMRQEWQKKHNRKKKVILIAFIALMLAAAVAVAIPLYNRYKDRQPRQVSVEHTGYMMWRGNVYEPEQVTVKLNGYIQEKVYYGDIDVAGAKGTIYSFKEIEFTIPNKINLVRKQEWSQRLDLIACAILDPDLESIIIEKADSDWNLNYEYIVDEAYKTEQYGKQAQVIYIYAPASSAQEAYEKYMNTFFD